MEGYQNSVKTVMRAASARRLRGIIGPVSSILRGEPGREVAIETALGGALQNIVVENEAAAKAGIALLRSENAGRATFLPLDTVQPGVFRGKLSGSARLASSLVQADARYSDIVSNLLGRIIVVDDINEASRVARDNGFRSKVVTLDGQVVNAGGSFTGGSVQRSAGLFTRKQELEELRVKAAKLQKECLAAQEKTDQCKQQADALNAELTAASSEQITAANDRVRAEAERKRLEAAMEQAETALAARQKEIDTLNTQLADSREKAAQAEAQEAALAGEIEAKSGELNRIAEGDDAFLTRQRALAEQVSAKRLEQVGRQKDAELAQAQMTREIFPKAPLKYMPPTKFMTGNIFRGHIQDALFNMVTILTNQKLHLLGMMTEAIHTPFMSDRALSIENAQYIFRTMKDLGDELTYKENGIIRNRANEVLTKATDLLKEIEKLGLFTTIEKGIFADVKRPKDGGKGLAGVVVKDDKYFNPFIEAMKGKVGA